MRYSLFFWSGSANPHSLMVCKSDSVSGAVDHGNTRQCSLHTTATATHPSNTELHLLHSPAEH